ncbi:MAG: hypothetical protein H6543_00635 [Prevotellaceae bacterium]|nr:hypothetical protein [Prevotellaceae bacterium]
MRKILYFIIISVLFMSCGAPTDEERAQAFLDEARVLYEQKNIEAAKIQLDSIHLLFPMLVDYRRQADTLGWQVELLEIQRNLLYVDSMLPLKTTEVIELKESFLFEKNEKYESVGTFVYKTLKTESNIGRCYLKPYTDENGGIYIMSYYVGKPINHNKLHISADDLFSETQPVDKSDQHQYVSLGQSYEIVLFRPETLGDVPDFITLHKNSPIKVTLLGGKRDYSYLLSESDKAIFVKTYQMSTVLADLSQLNALQRRMVIRKNLLNHKLNLK